VKELSYEQALAELETIVASLESSKLPLDETMSLYERGQALTKHCVELLDKAELRVKQLSGDALVDLPVED
jgi:exodeoxyribonuclease VII small subunit